MMLYNRVQELEEQVLQLKEQIRSLQQDSMSILEDQVWQLSEQMHSLQQASIKQEADLLGMRPLVAVLGQQPQPAKIIVKRSNGEPYAVDVDKRDTVDILKMRIEEIEGIPLEQQRLIFGLHQLEDEKTLADYNIQDESIVHLILRIRGC